MSRHFVARTQKEVEKFFACSLKEVDLPIIMVDGIHLDDHILVVALGIDMSGKKQVLGLGEGGTENEEVCELSRITTAPAHRGLHPETDPRLRLWAVVLGGEVSDCVLVHHELIVFSRIGMKRCLSREPLESADAGMTPQSPGPRNDAARRKSFDNEEGEMRRMWALIGSLDGRGDGRLKGLAQESCVSFAPLRLIVGVLRAAAVSLLLVLPSPPMAVAGSSQSFTFVHISDLHVTAMGHCRGADACDEGGVAFAEMLNVLKTLNPQPAFVIASGDNVDYGADAEIANPTGGSDNFRALTDQLSWDGTLKAFLIPGTTIPLYFCPGNHDSRESAFEASGQEMLLLSQSMCNYSKFINRDTAVPEECRYLGLKGKYNEDNYFDYHVTYGNTLILSMNSGRDTCVDFSTCIENPEGNGLLKPQMEWLAQTLADYASYSPKILFMHHPPANLNGLLCSDSPYCGVAGIADGSFEYNREGTSAATSFMQLCTDKGVALVLCGHVHQSARTERDGAALPDEPGASYARQGTDPTWFVQTANAYGGVYRLITVDASDVTVSGPLRVDTIGTCPGPDARFSISGSVLLDDLKTRAPGVTITLGSRTTTTNANGLYAITNLPNGSYTIKPSGGGFDRFSPSSRTVKICDQSALVDFIASRQFSRMTSKPKSSTRTGL